MMQLLYLFAVDSCCLALMKTSLESEETAAQGSEAASSSHPSAGVTVSRATPFHPGAAIRMDKANSLVHQLTHLLAGDHTEFNPNTQETLLAMDTRSVSRTLVSPRTFARSISLLRDTQWEILGDLPDECPLYSVCVCGVSDGIVMFGGQVIFSGEYTSYCYHFSVVTKQWKRLKDTPNSLAGASAVEFDDMCVLVIGGENAEGEGLDCMHGPGCATEHMVISSIIAQSFEETIDCCCCWVCLHTSSSK